MKTNKYLTKITFLVLAVLLTFAASAEAQRRKPTRKTPTTKTTPTTTTTSSLEVKDGANKVSIQIKNVTKFLYLLGSISTGIGSADKEAKAGKLSKAGTDTNNQYKQTVITSIRNLKAGLSALETEFNSKPSLRNYTFQIQGITQLAMQSEDLAAAGRFSDAGRPFLTVVEKLADTLTALP